MLSKGEIAPGQWVMNYGPVEKEKSFSVEEQNPFAMIAQAVSNPRNGLMCPNIVLSVELPFIVVGNPFLHQSTNNRIVTDIWRADEVQLQEVSKEFVLAYDSAGYNIGMQVLKRVQDTIKTESKPGY